MAQAATHSWVEVASSIPALAAMAAVALHLALRFTVRPCAQLRSGGPNKRWFHNQRYSRGELRAAAQAAIRMKTVVGKPGTMIPMMPSARLSTANASSNQRTGQGRERRTGVSAGGFLAGVAIRVL